MAVDNEGLMQLLAHFTRPEESQTNFAPEPIHARKHHLGGVAEEQKEKPEEADSPAAADKQAELDFASDTPQTPLDASGQPAAPMSNMPAQGQPQPQATSAPPAAAPNAPPAPPSAPAVGPHTVPIQNLSSSQIGGAREQEAQQTQETENQAYAQKSEALNKQEQLQEYNNNVDAQMAPQAMDIERDHQKTRDAVDAWYHQAAQDSRQQVDETIDKLKGEYDKDPNTFWGNANTSSKVSAAFGILGAALTHKDVGEYMDNLVNKQVNESYRKQKLLHQISRTRDAQDGRDQQQYRNDLVGLAAHKAAAYDILARQAAAKKALTANPQARAILENAQADLQLKANDSHKQAVKELTADRLEEAKQHVGEQRLAIEQEDHAQKTIQQKDPTEYIAVPGISGRGIQKAVQPKYIEHQAQVTSIADGLNDFLDISHKYAGDGDKYKTYLSLKTNRAALSAPLRKILNLGAKLEGKEQQTLDTLTPGIEDFVAGRIGLEDLGAHVKQIQKLLVNESYNELSQAKAPESQFTPGHPFYKYLKTYDDDAKKEQADTKEVQDILGSKDDRAHQELALEKAAYGTAKEPPNEMAKRILKEMRSRGQSTTAQDTSRGGSSYGPY